MIMKFAAYFVLLVICAGCHRPDAVPPHAETASLEIPPDLLTYRNDSAIPPMDGGNNLETDTYQRYAAIDSYPLLRAILLSPHAEDEVLAFDIERALILVGPSRFFADVLADAARNPQLFAKGVRHVLLERTHQPSVWVDASAFIDFRQMSPLQANAVLQRMMQLVQQGRSFDAVLQQFQDENTYRDGQAVLTKIGTLGDFVLSVSKPDAKPFRNIEFSAATVKQLLSLSPGEMTVCEWVNDHSDPVGRYLAVFHVKEVYFGK